MGNTSIIDGYLCSGEKVLYCIDRKSLTGTSEALAATNLRIIRAKGKSFFDIKYGHLSSIGNYTVYDRKRGFSALTNILMAALFFAAAMAIPGITAGFSDDFQAGLNSSFDHALAQMSQANGLAAKDLAIQGAGADTLQPEHPVAPAATVPQAGMIDLTGPFGTFGTLMAALTALTGMIYLVTGFYYMLVFLFSIKKGIVMKTPTEEFTFAMGRSRRMEAQEFIRTVRAAEEEKVRVLQQCMPEMFLKQGPRAAG